MLATQNRSHPVEDESVLAIGLCADITTTGDIDSGGAGWTSVMVTDRRLRWVLDIKKLDLDMECSLDLDDAGTWSRRVGLALGIHQHGGDNWPLNETIFAFSRPTTAAAQMLKEQLVLRGLRIMQTRKMGRLP